MNSLRLRLVLVTGLVTSMGAQGDILNKPVSLKTEGDLIQAVSTTLQHAVATSEQYRGTEPRLQRFARKEISARRKPIGAFTPCALSVFNRFCYSTISHRFRGISTDLFLGIAVNNNLFSRSYYYGIT